MNAQADLAVPVRPTTKYIKDFLLRVRGPGPHLPWCNSGWSGSTLLLFFLSPLVAATPTSAKGLPVGQEGHNHVFFLVGNMQGSCDGSCSHCSGVWGERRMVDPRWCYWHVCVPTHIGQGWAYFDWQGSEPAMKADRASGITEQWVSKWESVKPFESVS